MAEYLRQLRRLAAVPGTILFPAHGFPILDGPAKFEQYIAHRLLREARVREALAVTGGGTVEALLPHAYADTPVALYGLAARSCLAHHEKLVEDGLARRMGASGDPQCEWPPSKPAEGHGPVPLAASAMAARV
jgi:hypothetical protein